MRTLHPRLLVLALLGAGCAPGTARAEGPVGPWGPGDPSRPNFFEVPAATADTGSVLEVTGIGHVTVTPDRATIAFAVESEGASGQAASEANAEAMTNAIQALREAFTAHCFENPDRIFCVVSTSERIETFGYSLNPQYARSTGGGEPPRIVAYRVINNIRVTWEDVDAVGMVIDAAIGGGANRVSSLTFGIADSEGPRLEALRRAVANARAQAEAIADAMGVTLGEALEVHTGQTPTPRFQPEMRTLSLEAASTPIQAGDRDVTATVTIRYRLGR